MPNLFTGFGAGLYAFATRSLSLFRDINVVVANEILDSVASGTVLDVGTGPQIISLPARVCSNLLRSIDALFQEAVQCFIAIS